MSGSNSESRSLVNQFVQDSLYIGESVRAKSLRRLVQALGLPPTRLAIGTLNSMKFNPQNRKEAVFDIYFGDKESGVPRQDFSLTRRQSRLSSAP